MFKLGFCQLFWLTDPAWIASGKWLLCARTSQLGQETPNAQDASIHLNDDRDCWFRKEVVIDSRLLDKYVGRYGESANLVLTVKREGDHLCIQENDEPKQELFAESDHKFFNKVNADECTFEVDTQGRVTAIVLHVDGKDIRIKRLN